MKAIRKLEAEGYQFSLDGDQIHYKIIDGKQPDKMKASGLLKEIRDRKSEAIAFLKNTHSIRIFSKVLNREATISWQGDDPKIIYLDQAGYTLDEIARLKQTKDPEMVKKTHQIKNTFDGELT